MVYITINAVNIKSNNLFIKKHDMNTLFSYPILVVVLKIYYLLAPLVLSISVGILRDLIVHIPLSLKENIPVTIS